MTKKKKEIPKQTESQDYPLCSEIMFLEDIRHNLFEFKVKDPEILEELQNRPLTITFIRNCYGEVGTVLMSLYGSPPQGYALYITGRRFLSFYDSYGQRWRVIKDIILPEIYKFIKEENYQTSDYVVGGNYENIRKEYGPLLEFSKN